MNLENVTIECILPALDIAYFRGQLNQYNSTRTDYVEIEGYTPDTRIHYTVPIDARLTAINNESTKNLNTNDVKSLIGNNRPVLLTFTKTTKNKNN